MSPPTGNEGSETEGFCYNSLILRAFCAVLNAGSEPVGRVHETETYPITFLRAVPYAGHGVKRTD